MAFVVVASGMAACKKRLADDFVASAPLSTNPSMRRCREL